MGKSKSKGKKRGRNSTGSQPSTQGSSSGKSHKKPRPADVAAGDGETPVPPPPLSPPAPAPEQNLQEIISSGLLIVSTNVYIALIGTIMWRWMREWFTTGSGRDNDARAASKRVISNKHCRVRMVRPEPDEPRYCLDVDAHDEGAYVGNAIATPTRIIAVPLDSPEPIPLMLRREKTRDPSAPFHSMNFVPTKARVVRELGGQFVYLLEPMKTSSNEVFAEKCVVKVTNANGEHLPMRNRVVSEIEFLKEVARHQDSHAGSHYLPRILQNSQPTKQEFCFRSVLVTSLGSASAVPLQDSFGRLTMPADLGTYHRLAVELLSAIQFVNHGITTAHGTPRHYHLLGINGLTIYLTHPDPRRASIMVSLIDGVWNDTYLPGVLHKVQRMDTYATPDLMEAYTAFLKGQRRGVRGGINGYEADAFASARLLLDLATVAVVGDRLIYAEEQIATTPSMNPPEDPHSPTIDEVIDLAAFKLYANNGANAIPLAGISDHFQSCMRGLVQVGGGYENGTMESIDTNEWVKLARATSTPKLPT